MAKFESKYAEELAACGVLAIRPSPLFVPPKMVVTGGTEAAKPPPKAKAVDHEAIQALAEMDEEEVRQASAPVKVEPCEPSAGASAGVMAGALGECGSASSAGASLASATAAQWAYQVPSTGMRSLPAMSSDKCSAMLWKSLAQQGLTQMFLKHKHDALSVEVSVLEASAPVVYQARALKDFAIGALVLVPYTEATLIDFGDGAKAKRPKSLHPHLPFLITCVAGAFEMDDTAQFLIKSPLASVAGVPPQAPTPFWAV